VPLTFAEITLSHNAAFFNFKERKHRVFGGRTENQTNNNG
jgi:hypothetical protein